MKRTFITIALVSMFASSSSMADEQSTRAIHETTGLGVGALIGGLIAGPPGIVLGAIGGTVYGNRQGEKQNHITSVEKKLQDREVQLALVRNELSQTRTEYTSKMQKATLENRRARLDKLSDGVSLSVFFRTDESTVDPGLKPHLQKLVTLIKDIPEITITLDAYADQRGDELHNLELSRARAQAVEVELIEAGLPGQRIKQYAHGESNTRASDGDVEGYVFDRRVDIELTIDKEA